MNRLSMQGTGARAALFIVRCRTDPEPRSDPSVTSSFDPVSGASQEVNMRKPTLAVLTTAVLVGGSTVALAQGGQGHPAQAPPRKAGLSS